MHRLGLAELLSPAGLNVSPALAAGVSFASPGNNATVSGPVHVEMKVSGMEVKPAGELPPTPPRLPTPSPHPQLTH